MRVTPKARIAAAALTITALDSAPLTGCSASPNASGGTSAGWSTLLLWTDALRAPALKAVASQLKKGTGVTMKLVI